jgi:fumarate hydratase class II
MIISNASVLLADKAIKTFKVNEEKLKEALHKNPILVTALNPVIGYSKAAEIAKRAYAENRPIIEIAKEETDLPLEELETLLDPVKLTQGGL